MRIISYKASAIDAITIINPTHLRKEVFKENMKSDTAQIYTQEQQMSNGGGIYTSTPNYFSSNNGKVVT